MNNGELYALALEVDEISNQLNELSHSIDLALIMEDHPNIPTNEMRELAADLRELNIKIAITFGNRIQPSKEGGDN